MLLADEHARYRSALKTLIFDIGEVYEPTHAQMEPPVDFHLDEGLKQQFYFVQKTHRNMTVSNRNGYSP